MDDLRRQLAPIASETWKVIDDEARRTLALHMAARKLVEFDGPHGWRRSAVSGGRADPLADAPVKGLAARLRRVRPLVELRAPFDMPREELDAIERGEQSADLSAVVEAARRLAHGEDRAVFHGWPEAGIVGIVSASPHEAVPLTSEYASWPRAVARATESLRQAGVGGPYALALGPQAYDGLASTTGDGGYPVLQHVRRLVDGPVVWAPALAGAVALSLRGGDFQLVVGRDASIGYDGHDEQRVRLYLELSFSFRLFGPEAAVAFAQPR